MNKQKVATMIDRISIRLSLLGLLGLAGLAGFFNFKYFGLSYLSYLSFFAYIRFVKLFFIPKLTISAERDIIMWFSLVIPCLAPIIQGYPALGFLGFLGFVALVAEKPNTELIVQENA
jgi:hypothetical protein